MLKKMFLLLMMIGLLSMSCYANVSSLPAAIIASVWIDSEKSYLYPDIVIGEDGIWREGNCNDLFIEQEFTVFCGPEKQKLAEKLIIEKNNSELPVRAIAKGKIEPGFRYWSYFSNNKTFKNKAVEKVILPEQIDIRISKGLQKNISKSGIKKLIDIDRYKISNDFKMRVNTTILQFLKGDINGDHIQDYILALGKGYGLEREGIVVIVYISDKGVFKRIPVKSWKNNTDYASGPDSLFLKDVNGDKADELFVIDSDSDGSYPIVYSWFKNGLQKVYAGKSKLWSGI